NRNGARMGAFATGPAARDSKLVLAGEAGLRRRNRLAGRPPSVWLRGNQSPWPPGTPRRIVGDASPVQEKKRKHRDQQRHHGDGGGNPRGQGPTRHRGPEGSTGPPPGSL